jgi:AraC-like DNA-binding protein
MCCNYSKLPSDVTSGAVPNKHLTLEGLTVVRTYSSPVEEAVSLYVEMHTLCFIQRGTLNVTLNEGTFDVHEGQIVLMHKAQMLHYKQTGDADGIYQNLLFFLADEFLDSFIKMSGISFARLSEPVVQVAQDVNERLQNYFRSVEAYFDEEANVDEALIRLKFMELLYELSNVNKNLLLQLLQARQQVKSDINRVIDDNYLKPLAVADFAYLSGRSLAAFKRDFTKVYGTSPAVYIKEKRLAKAREMLHNTQLPVSEICFLCGFESIAHFSKAYKAAFGVPPSHTRKLKAA